MTDSTAGELHFKQSSDAIDHVDYENELRLARAQSQQLAAIVQSSHDGIISVGLDAIVRSWSPGAARMFGYTATEAVGQSVDDLIVPSNLLAIRKQKYEKLSAGETVVFNDTVRHRKDGTLVPVEITATPMRNELQHVTAASIVFRDITQRKKTEAALRQNEHFLRQITDIMPSVLQVFDLSEKRCVFINRSVAQLLGYKPEVVEAMGTEVVQYLMHPDDLPKFEQHIEDIRNLADGEILNFEHRMRDTTGKWHWFHSCDAVFTRKIDGTPRELIGVASEISDRKHADEQLRRSHDTYLNLIRNNPFGVYLVDNDFRLAQISKGAEKVFSKVQPLLNRDLAEVLRIIWEEPFATEAISRFRHTLDSGEPFHSRTTTENRADLDEVESYDWRLERVAFPDGRFGVVCYFYDMTERMRYEQHLNLLMGEVSHRSKNLLTVVQAVAQQTMRDGDPATFKQSLFQRIQGLAANQDILVRNQWSGVELQELVHSQLAPFRELLDQRVVIAGPTVSLSATAAQGIGMALHELATNAIKYGALSNEDGRVHINWKILEQQEPLFGLEWREEDGPEVTEPRHNGFGHKVIVRMVEASVNGKVELTYDKKGLLWKLQVPLSKIKETEMAF
jgi:PAS domain S-box-containing protein